MKYQTQLRPIHFDSDSFKAFLQTLQKYSEVEDFEATAIWDGGKSKVTFTEASQLVEDGSIPNQILSFDLRLQADKGYIWIDAIGSKEYHRLIVNGEEEWTKTNVQNITEFVESQGNELRSWLSHRNLFYLQLFVAGVFISNFLPFIWTVINPLMTVPISTEQLLIGAGLFGIITLLEVPKRIYPYVVLCRNGTEPLYRTIVSIIIPIISVIGAALSAVALLS